MKTIKKPNYTLLISAEESVLSFHNEVTSFCKNMQKTDLVIQFSDNLNITFQEINLFLNIWEVQKKQRCSFVIIAGNIDIETFPEDLNVVPTLVEAEDVLEMEAIERDLGF